MTNKQIIYSAHAVGRLKRRKTGRAEVRWVLAQGVLKKELEQKGRTVWSKTGYIGKQEVKVVYLEGRKAILVITVEYLPKTPRNRRKHPKQKF